MVYTPQTWADGSGGGTPITAARLNYMEAGITSGNAPAPDPIVLTPTGVASTDGPAMDAAVTQALAEKRSIYLKAGTFNRTTTWNCRGDGLTILTDGTKSVRILQETNNTPILQVGGWMQRISGLWLEYLNAQAVGNTSANALEFHKAYEGVYTQLFIQKAARGLYLPQIHVDLGNGDSVGNYLFSCTVGNVRVASYTICAVDLRSFSNTSTGCIFSNIYTVNEEAVGGAPGAAARAVNLLAWDEVQINQLNIEGVAITQDGAVLLDQVRVGRVSGLHFERVTNTVWGSAFLIVNNPDCRVFVDSVSLAFSPFANAAGGQQDRLGIFKIGDGSQLFVDGFQQHDNTPLTAPERPLVVSDSASTGAVYVRGSGHSGLTTAVEATGGSPQFPLVKQLNDEWFHYKEGGGDVTFGTAAPTTGTWARGSKRWNTAPSAGGTPGWVCVTAGGPGTWKSMANLAA